MTATISPEVLPAFDSESLPPEARILITQRMSEIDGLFRSRTQNAIEIGIKFLEIKQAVGHGNWKPWFFEAFSRDQIPRSYPTIARWMGMAQVAQKSQIEIFTPSAAYALVGDDVAIKAATEITADRGALPCKLAKRIKAAPVPDYQPEQAVYVNLPDHKLHGQKGIVQAVEGKLARVQVGDREVPLFAHEIADRPPSEIKPQPIVKPEPIEVRLTETLQSEIDILAARNQWLTDLVARISACYDSTGEIADPLLAEMAEAIA